MNLKARYFDGKTSASQDVEIVLYDDRSIKVEGIVKDNEPITLTATIDQLRISERIGNTPRRIFFSDGSLCELSDNDTFDDWLTDMQGHSLEHSVHLLERHWRIAVAAVLVTALVTFVGIRYGVPALAKHAANVIPVSVDRELGRESITILDKAFFAPSELSEEKKSEIRADFARIVEDSPKGPQYQLEFRKGGSVGANALALPSGIVVITDELVELSENHNEIVAVLAHEVGHVVHRHALRSILQSSASAALMVGLLGDFTSISSILSAAPTVLIQAKFSRTLETEADDFSYAWLRDHGIPTHYFGDLLLRLEEKHGGEKGSDSFSYFSSHPRTKERVHD